MYIENSEIKNVSALQKGAEYEKCKFLNCDFSNQVLEKNQFIDCVFQSCNFSLVRMPGISLQNVEFLDCKILGVKFDEASDFGFEVHFDNCTLNHSVFYKKKMKKNRFYQCQLESVDFEQCDLTEVHFKECNLLGANFNQSNLNKADFRSAMHFSIDLEQVQCKKTRFSKTNISGLLKKYPIDIN